MRPAKFGIIGIFEGGKPAESEVGLVLKARNNFSLNRHSERIPRSSAPGLASELQIFPLL